MDTPTPFADAIAPAPAPAVDPAATPDAAADAAAASDAADPKVPVTDPKAADAAKAKAKAEAEAVKKWKLKIDGREEELGEEDLIKHAQMGKAAQKRMQEVAEERRQFKAFIEQLQKDPISILTNPHLGVDVKKMAEVIINQEIEELKKPADVREREKLQKELEAIKKQHESEKQLRERAEFERMQEQAARQLDVDIDDALKDSGLPKSGYTVRKMAELMMLALENNIDLNAKDAVPILRNQLKRDLQEMFSASPEDVIEEFVGKDNFSRVRKKTLAKLKAAPQSTEVKATGADLKKESKAEEKKIQLKDWLRSR